jgi:replicative DNA helicase
MNRRSFLHTAVLCVASFAGLRAHSDGRQRTDTEKAVLSCLLLSGSTLLGDAEQEVCADQFRVPEHRVIFRALAALHSARRAIDIVTITQRLFDDGQLDAAGGAERLVELYTFIPSAENYRYYVDALRSRA